MQTTSIDLGLPSDTLLCENQRENLKGPYIAPLVDDDEDEEPDDDYYAEQYEMALERDEQEYIRKKLADIHTSKKENAE